MELKILQLLEDNLLISHAFSDTKKAMSFKRFHCTYYTQAKDTFFLFQLGF
jgi:hypothetical protein